MACLSLGRASWLPLALTLTACGNRDETRVLPVGEAAPVVNPVRPEADEGGDEPPVATATLDAGFDAAVTDEPVVVGEGDAGGAASGGDAGVTPPVSPQPPAVPAPLCGRLGVNPFDALTNVILDLLFEQSDDCRTAGLLPVPDEETQTAWGGYLFDYTSTVLACPEAVEPPGGLDVFPLSNTGIAGVDSAPPAIGSDDAEVLIEQYLDLLSVPLALTLGERAEFEAYLRYQAGKVIDPEVSGALSICPP
jgi:hypothetical protein